MKRLIPLLAVLALVLAACGGGSDDGVATLQDTETTVDQGSAENSSGTDDEQALLAFSACMRENSVPDFPDPVLNADGSVDFNQGGGDPFGSVEPDTAEAAVNACLDELDGVSFAPGGTDFDLNEIQDAFVEFAQCMRDEGIDFDDPDLLGAFSEGGVSNPFGELDITDPEVRAAVEVCQEAFVGVGPGFGG